MKIDGLTAETAMVKARDLLTVPILALPADPFCYPVIITKPAHQCGPAFFRMIYSLELIFLLVWIVAARIATNRIRP